MSKIINKINSHLNKLRNSESFKARIARGTIWSGLGNGSEQVLRFIRNMILTRILAPEAFGLMAIVLAVNAAFESFTQIGIKEAIIQNPKGQEKEYLNGAWWLAFGRAVVLYLVVFITAPWIAQFYENPELIPLMRVAFLGLILNGLMSSEAYIAVKKMNFKRWVLIWNGGSFLGIITAVTLAFMLQNVWALVIGFTVEHLSRCILSYIICPFFPGLKFNRENLNALLKFARGIFGVPILTFIWMRADIFVVGKLCDIKDLGLYSMAIAMAWMPFHFITMIMNQMMLPAFSEKQMDKEWVNKWTLNITSLIAYIGFPLLFFVTLYGRDILNLVYGSAYGAVSIPFAIIFAAVFIRTISVPIATVYFANGRPDLHRLFTVIRAVLIIALIYPLTKWFGLIGAAVSVFLSMAIGFFFQVKRIYKVTGLNLKNYFSVFLPAFYPSLCVAILWIGTNYYFSSWPLVNMIPGLIGCLISYVISIKLLLRSKTGSVTLADGVEK